MKTITENRLNKRLHGMDKSDLCKMIVKMYESSKTAKVLISQYSGNDAYRKKFYDLCGDEISGLTDVAAMNGFSPDIEDSWVNTIPEWKL